MAASLSDSSILGANALFVARVQSALATACISIFAEGIAVNNHRDRVSLVHQVLQNPTQLTAWSTNFAVTVATDTSVIADATQAGTVVLTAGNVATQQALVTDAHLNSAIAGQFNAFCSSIPA